MTNNSTTRPRRLLAVDGPSLLHRAYHAGKPRDEQEGMTNSAGRPVWATYGFLSILAAICENVDPGYLVVGFDSDTSKRSAIYPPYKAQRGEKDADLKSQMEDIQSLLTALCITTITPEGLEADDVVASAAHQAEAHGGECVIATSDRDSFGLVTDKVTVLRILDGGIKNARRITPEALFELYKVTPANYLSYAALRGDKSDNLPGANGIGEKTAAKLLAATDVASALDDLAVAEAAIGKSYAAKLHAGRADYERNLQIMGLQRDIPVPLGQSALGQFSANGIRETLLEWEFPHLVSRVTRALHGYGTPSTTQTPARSASAPNVPAPSAPARNVVPSMPSPDTDGPAQGALMAAPVEVAPMAAPGTGLHQLPEQIPGTSIRWPQTL